MAWYEQLDLDFGNIHDQFSDLIGEASTLIENANNLEILNLDAMAVQDEINEALKKEVEEDEEEVDGEVVYHDSIVDDHDDCDDRNEASEFNITDNTTLIQQSTPEKNKEGPWQDETDIYSPALTMNTTEKPPRNIISSDDSPSKFEESFSWEGIDSKPAKHVKMLNSTAYIHTQDNITNTASAVAPIPVAGGMKKELLPAPAVGNNSLQSNTSSTVQPKPKPLPSSIPATGGRKVKPLKPKQKVQKQLDFFGVGSSSTGQKTTEKKIQKGSNTIDTQEAMDNGSDSLLESKQQTHKDTNAGSGGGGSSDLFFGLFGDDSYNSEHNAEDIESGATQATTTSTTENNSAIQPVHSQRLPLGWLSSMVGTTADGSSAAGDTATSVFSFFDDPEDGTLTEEDPILKQVEYNRLHPHAAAELRQARAGAVGGSVSKVLDMWSAFMTEDNSSSVSGSSSGVNNTTKILSASSTKTQDSATVSQDQIEAIISGVGPVWVVACLTWLRRITGVSLSILDTSNTVLYRGNSGGPGSTVGTVRSRIEQNLKYVNFRNFTTQLHLPAEYTTLSVCILLLYMIRLLCMILIALVMRIIVVLCTLLGVCVRCTVRYMSGTAVGRAGSERLRRFFLNENVNAVLGSDSNSGSGSSEQSYIGRLLQDVRGSTGSLLEHLNSTNAIVLLTAALLIFSYFKFQRYGTDAGN